MPAIRTPSQKKRWYIPKHTFLAARHYALQYEDWRDEYRTIVDLQKKDEGEGHSNLTGDPTGSAAIRAAELSEKMQLVEKTVADVDKDLYNWLLIAVTRENMTYTVLNQRLNIPCSAGTFYDRRRMFYYLLASRI